MSYGQLVKGMSWELDEEASRPAPARFGAGHQFL